MNSRDGISIVIADDHPMFRNGLRAAIERNTSYVVIGEAGDGAEAYRLIAAKQPRIAVLDVEMPRLSGLDVARRVHEEDLPVAMIILTMYDEASVFNRAMDLGVTGYILKETAVPDIIHGISKVVHGEYYISPALASLLQHRDHAAGPEIDHLLHLDRLTAVERRVLRLIAEARSSRSIADHLSVSTRTVESHRYNISRKLGLSGSYALLRFAVENRDAV